MLSAVSGCPVSAEYKRHMVRTFVVRLLSRTDAAAERAA